MKRILTIICLCALVYACNTETKPKIDGYLVSGDAPGVYNGIRVYLGATDERGRKVNKDTAIVMNEKFEFKGKLDSPKMWFLSVNSVNGSIPLVVENEPIEITIDKDNIENSIVKGGNSNQALQAYTEESKKLDDQRKKLYSQYKTAQDEDSRSKVTEAITNVADQMSELPYKYFEENKDNSLGLVLLNDLLKTKNVDLDRVSDNFYKLDSKTRSSTFGLQINSQIVSLKRVRDAENATKIGNMAPEFTAPTPDGKQLALKDALGKVTIVDFWAAWCGPCRRENPNVVRIYDKYHDKGLEIIGVSLDGNNRQKDPKDAWVKAIEKDKLTWNHVSNLKYFNDPVAKAYNIKSIPATFILDENGTIVAKNLRGSQLEAKIAELLD